MAGAKPSNVEPISLPPQATPVSDELTKLTEALRGICPQDAVITFEFDGKLHLNVHLRRFEDVTRVETALPSLCGMIFHDIRHGQVGRHSFLHLVSALVAR